MSKMRAILGLIAYVLVGYSFLFVDDFESKKTLWIMVLFLITAMEAIEIEEIKKQLEKP